MGLAEQGNNGLRDRHFRFEIELGLERNCHWACGRFDFLLFAFNACWAGTAPGRQWAGQRNIRLDDRILYDSSVQTTVLCDLTRENATSLGLKVLVIFNSRRRHALAASGQNEN